jgi:hypothetical protein
MHQQELGMLSESSRNVQGRGGDGLLVVVDGVTLPREEIDRESG